AKPQPLLMRARQHVVPVGVPTHQVGGDGEPLQVLRGQPDLPVGRRQLVEGVRPRPPPKGLPAPNQCVTRGHGRSPPPGRGPPATPARRSPSAPRHLTAFSNQQVETRASRAHPTPSQPSTVCTSTTVESTLTRATTTVAAARSSGGLAAAPSRRRRLV